MVKLSYPKEGTNILRLCLLKTMLLFLVMIAFESIVQNWILACVKFIHNDKTACGCMGIETEFVDILQQIVSTEKLFSSFNFPTVDVQTKVIEYLKEKNEDLYQNLDISKRTIYVRVTGDNFRAAAKFPTELTSFSIFNMPALVNNPYGQFVPSLWCGSEDRHMLELHVRKHFNDLEAAVKNGVNLVVNGEAELFNIIVFFVADLSFVKDD